MQSAVQATAAPQYDRRQARELVAAFSLGWVVILAGLGLLSPLLPLVRAEFGLSGTAAGLLTWAFSLPYLLMQIPAGVLSDRFGAKRLLVGMLLLSGLGMAALGLWSYSLLALVIFAVVHRLGSGVYYPTSFGLLSAVVPATARATASSFLIMGMALGATLGTALAVPLYQLAGNWRFPWLVFGLLTLLLAALHQLATRPVRLPEKAAGGGAARVLRDRSLAALFAINFCSAYAFTVLTTWGPSFLVSERGLALAEAGFYIALLNLVGFPASLLSGLLSDRVGRRGITVLLFIAAAGSLVAVGILRQPALLLGAVVLYGLSGKWSSDGVLAGWMADHVASKFARFANTVFGIGNTARLSGTILAPLVSGALLDTTGSLVAGFFVGAGALLVAACLAPLVAERDYSPQAG
ncbi:MAG: MFS transporter [Chloroflexota bacterium]